MALTVKTSDGKLLDTVRLVAGKLHYDTEAAKDIFEAKRGSERLSDPDVYALLTDWSNGYMVSKWS